jgi:mRNA-degrading endonuclease toxin of MazEF toxin-antitoxin module
LKLPKEAQPTSINPRRGEIWRVNFEPTVGSEMSSDKGNRGDTRPALVLSLPKIGERSVRLCAPITDYLPDRDGARFWRVEIGDNEMSGLSKTSCVDVSQTRALDTSRFIRKDGAAHNAEVEASARTLALIVGVSIPSKNEDAE